MKIRELFETAENGILTYEQFEAAMKLHGAKFADLSDGAYVSKSKYEADLKERDTKVDTLTGQIENLNTTITTRDADLVALQQKLEEAGQDATKLADLGTQFSALQTKYDQDIKDYESKMTQQAYEFAVREFANTKQFTSQAAKRDFTQAMIQKQLQMENGKLIGGEDFVSLYTADNADAFVVEQPEFDIEDSPVTNRAPIPEFVASTPGIEASDNNAFHFNFTGVRAHQ